MTGLTARQLVLLESAFRGKCNKEMGRLCGVSPLTVKNHLRQLYRKLGARNRAEAVYVALARGMLEPPPRVAPTPLPTPPAVTDWLCAGNLRLSLSMSRAEVDGRPLALRGRLLLVLAALAARPGLVYSRQQLLDYVIGTAYSIQERVMDRNVSELRIALAEAGCTCTVRTMRGRGYWLSAPPREGA